MTDDIQKKQDRLLRSDAEELMHLWKTHVDADWRPKTGASVPRPFPYVLALVLIVAALFVDDALAWGVLDALVSAVVEIVHHTGNYIPYPLGINRH